MSNELYHHGIKGMHWGVRRYQNPDGTLTNAGKRRELRDQARADKAARKAVKIDRKYAKKNASILSDSELNARINRLQKERQFKDLSEESIKPGRYKAKQLLDRYGQQAVGALVGVGVSATVGKVIGANTERWMSTKGYHVKNYRNGIPYYKDTDKPKGSKKGNK